MPLPHPMGCGQISQRGPSVEVRHPLALDASGRAAGARIVTSEARAHYRLGDPHAGASSGSGPSTTSSSTGGSGANADQDSPGVSSEAGSSVRGSAMRHDDRGRVSDQSHHARPSGGGRRLIMGERVVAARLPGNPQDQAFCFECGVFFTIGTSRAPQCVRCGSNFVQFLRGVGDQHWISAESTTGLSFSFDDQLDNSITASIDETPMARKPTKGAFLRGLPTIQLTQEEVEQRSLLGNADPRRSCAICRDGFCVGDCLKQLPCNHEFHEPCVVTWLTTNNTCPICRWRCPEATEGEEEKAEGDTKPF